MCLCLPLLVNVKGLALEQDARRAQHHQLQLTVLKYVLPLHSMPWSIPLPFEEFVCAGGSKCLRKSISTVNHQLCLELWETGGLVYLLESPWRDSMRKIT